jgi:hypothetical protein
MARTAARSRIRTLFIIFSPYDVDQKRREYIAWFPSVAVEDFR